MFSPTPMRPRSPRKGPPLCPRLGPTQALHAICSTCGNTAWAGLCLTGGVWGPKVCVPQMARLLYSSFFPGMVTLVWKGAGHKGYGYG